MEKQLLSNLIRVFRRHWKRFALASLLITFSNGLLVLNPLIFRRALMEMRADTDRVFESMFFWASVLLAVSLLASCFKYAMRLLFISISREVEAGLRLKLYSRIQRQSAAFFDRHRIGSLLSRLTNDISSYREVLGPGLMYPMFFVTLVLPALGALYMISVPPALLATAPILSLPILMLLIRKTTYATSLDVQSMLGKMSDSAHEHYSGIRVVKAYNGESGALKEFAVDCSRFMSLNLWLSGIKGVFFPFLSMLTKIVTVLLVVLVGYMIFYSWNALSAADFISFMWIQSFIFIPVLMLGWILPIYIQGSAAYQRLVEIYHEPIEVADFDRGIERFPSKASLEFTGLSFCYPSANQPALKDVRLRIEPGSFIGICGPVGSGKTTLFRILTREYEISRGMVKVGGKDLRDYKLGALRESIMAVEQNPFLFSATIEENLCFGVEGYTQEDLDAAARKADLYDTIKGFTQGYLTIVGERGVTLSGGQKQRLALARALMVDRQIYLFDDVFSAVDSTTEKKIFAEIKKSFSGKTVLMVTPRASILHQMDRVFYLQEGAVVEEGAPEQLKEREGHFAALVDLQMMEQGELQ